jgi:hypothetical protein
MIKHIFRDALGFKRPTQWVKASKLYEFEQRYKMIQEKQTKSWNKLYINNDQKWPELCPQRKYPSFLYEMIQSHLTLDQQ